MLYTRRTFFYEYGLKDADIAILGIPFSSTQIGKQTKYGPVLIREALKEVIGFDPLLKVNVFKECKFCDLGDIEVVPGDWSLTKKRINDTIKGMFAENPHIFPVFIGGEHLISLGILEALAEIVENNRIKGEAVVGLHNNKNNEKTSSIPGNEIIVIDIDAHRDLMKDWLGESYSHVTWAYRLIKEKKERFRLIQVGCRSWSEEEDIENNGNVRMIKTNEIERIKSVSFNDNPIYITIDLDVIDPAFVNVGTPEPFGLTPEKFFEILDKILSVIDAKKLIGLDIVECAEDKLNNTSLIAAQMIKKVLGSRMKGAHRR